MAINSRLSRRAFLGILGFGASAAVIYVVLPPRGNGGAATLTPDVAQDLLSRQKLTLIDVRRPDEWQRTGTAPGAVRIDMRRSDFVAAVQYEVAAAPDRPVAIICAAGVRSARMTRLLTEAGITGVIDIPEGMTGSRAGPGWIARGLPVLPYSVEN